MKKFITFRCGDGQQLLHINIQSIVAIKEPKSNIDSTVFYISLSTKEDLYLHLEPSHVGVFRMLIDCISIDEACPLRNPIDCLSITSYPPSEEGFVFESEKQAAPKEEPEQEIQYSSEKQLWTISEAAAWIGVTDKKLYSWHYNGRFVPPVKVGKRLMWAPEQVKEWLKGKKKIVAPE